MSTKFLPLVWAGLWRRPARTIFTGLCITIAFLLLGLLEGVNAAWDKAIAESNSEYLFCRPLARNGTPMPVAAMDKIRALPGVKDVYVRVYFAGAVKDPATIHDSAAAIATEPAKFFQMTRKNFIPAPGSVAALLATRDGMVATPALLKQFGWKVGDSVVLKSPTLRTDGSPYWKFHIVGTFAPQRDPDHLWLGIINYSYIEEGRAENRGTAETFYIRIADPTKGTATAAAVDAIFANSPSETLTLSGQQRAEHEAKQMGDIRFFTNAILAAVLFTLAFITGNTLRQSLHDRIPEFAVLKAIGYRHVAVLVIAYAEALLLYIPFAVVGLGIAYLLAPLAQNDFGSVVVSFGVASMGLICAALLALIGVALPASTLARMSVVAALGRR